MKDGLHLLGGMGGAILALVLYIFCWGTLQKCFGGERFSVTTPSGDGVNYVTTEVDENGYVESVRTTTAYVPQKYIPQSGEHVMIGDSEFVMVSVGDWTRWTNAIARLESVAERRWKKEHQTEEGRGAWHGAATNRIVDADSVIWLYRDGFVYTEEVKPAPRRSPAVKQNAAQSRRTPPVPSGLPPRLTAKKKALQNRPATKEVNATFGPGGKLLKVEESK